MFIGSRRSHGPNEIQNGEQIQNDASFFTIGAAYITGVTHCKAHIYGAKRTNAIHGHAQMPPSVIKPTKAAQNSTAR